MLYELSDTKNHGRDAESKAVISTDMGALAQLKEKRRMSQKINELEGKIVSVEASLNNITSLLKTLLERNA